MKQNFLSEKILKNILSCKIYVVDAGSDLFNNGRKCWDNIGRANLLIDAFDCSADVTESRAIEASLNGWDHHYHCLALSSEDGLFDLHYSEKENLGSGFWPNKKNFNHCNYDGNKSMYELNKVTNSVVLNKVALDNFLEKNNRVNVDFIKLNIQGSELDALQGFIKGLKNCVGVEIELSFNSLYENSPHFSDIDPFLRGHGFYLFDLLAPNVVGYRNNFLYHVPQRLLGNHNFPKKQLFEGHFLYLKNPLIENLSVTTKEEFIALLKLIVIAEGYGQIEYAFTLIEQFINSNNTDLFDNEKILLKEISEDAANCYKYNMKIQNLKNKIINRLI